MNKSELKPFTRNQLEKEGYEFIKILKYSEIYHKKIILYFIDVSGTYNPSTLEFAYYVNKNKGLHIYIVINPINNKPIYIVHDFCRNIKHISYILSSKIIKQC